jgi:hypothetical protein
MRDPKLMRCFPNDTNSSAKEKMPAQRVTTDVEIPPICRPLCCAERPFLSRRPAEMPPITAGQGPRPFPDVQLRHPERAEPLVDAAD